MWIRKNEILENNSRWKFVFVHGKSGAFRGVGLPICEGVSLSDLTKLKRESNKRKNPFRDNLRFFIESRIVKQC